MILYESNPKFVNRSSNHTKSMQETRNDGMIYRLHILLNPHNPHNLFSILLLILHPDE